MSEHASPQHYRLSVRVYVIGVVVAAVSLAGMWVLSKGLGAGNVPSYGYRQEVQISNHTGKAIWVAVRGEEMLIHLAGEGGPWIDVENRVGPELNWHVQIPAGDMAVVLGRRTSDRDGPLEYRFFSGGARETTEVLERRSKSRIVDALSTADLKLGEGEWKVRLGLEENEIVVQARMRAANEPWEHE